MTKELRNKSREAAEMLGVEAELISDMMMKVTIGGVDYTIKKVPMRTWVQMVDKWAGDNGRPVDEIMFDEVFRNMVVEPMGISWDEDFDYLEDVQKIVAHAVLFQNPSRDDLGK